MSEDPELFYSPRLQYLSMKKTFLGKFHDRKVWGEFGSEEQLVAVSGLLEYYRETRSLAEHFPQILDEVIIDNKNLVLEHVLPMLRHNQDCRNPDSPLPRLPQPKLPQPRLSIT